MYSWNLRILLCKSKKLPPKSRLNHTFFRGHKINSQVVEQCMHVCMYIYVSIYSKYMFVFMYVCRHVCSTYVVGEICMHYMYMLCMYWRMYVSMYNCLFLPLVCQAVEQCWIPRKWPCLSRWCKTARRIWSWYVCMYICMYVCTYRICVYVCTYVCVQYVCT